LKKIISAHLFPLATCLLLLASCTKIDVFEKNAQIPKHEWKWDYKPEISFSITDTTSAYNVFITLRHTDAYEYRNLWLFVATKQPGDTSYNQKERIELPLQSPDGKWLSATGMDDIWEHRIRLFDKVRFKKSGTYSIQLEQNMRDNPLKHIMNAGVRIEKIF
jgi:gliding motility-associated lipoprotein GldH